MSKSKYEKPLRALMRKPLFTSKEADAVGIPTRMLAYFCKQGLIERAGRGIYFSLKRDRGVDIQWEDFAYIAASIPNGTICMISALCFYGMTDQIMREFWLAIPNNQWAPVRKQARVIRMRNTTLGRTTVRMGQFEFKIFDRERTVIDAFRYLSSEIALKALQAYLFGDDQPSRDIAKLSKYAKILHVDIHPYIIALTT